MTFQEMNHPDVQPDFSVIVMFLSSWRSRPP